MSDVTKMREDAQAARELLAKQAAERRGETAPAAIPVDGGSTAAPASTLVVQPKNRQDQGIPQGGGDKDAMITQLRAELQKHKVEEGRVKALAAEVEALKRENAELRQQVAEAKAVPPKSLIESVDPSRRDIVDEDILKANEDMIRVGNADLMAQVSKMLAPIQEELGRERATRAEAEKAAFDALIEGAHPGFMAATNEGGSLCDPWDAFLNEPDPMTGEPYGVVLERAYTAKRFAAVDAAITVFKNKVGITRREQLRGAALPSSSAPGGTAPVGLRDTTRYTQSQIQKGLEQARKDWEAKRITLSDRNAILHKFQLAISEGRVIRDPVPPVGG